MMGGREGSPEARSGILQCNTVELAVEFPVEVVTEEIGPEAVEGVHLLRLPRAGLFALAEAPGLELGVLLLREIPQHLVRHVLRCVVRYRWASAKAGAKAGAKVTSGAALANGLPLVAHDPANLHQDNPKKRPGKNAC